MLVPCTRKACATNVIRKKQKRTAMERSWPSSQRTFHARARGPRCVSDKGERLTRRRARRPWARGSGSLPSHHAGAGDPVVEAAAAEGDHEVADAEQQGSRGHSRRAVRWRGPPRSGTRRHCSRRRAREAPCPVWRREHPSRRRSRRPPRMSETGTSATDATGRGGEPRTGAQEPAATTSTRGPGRGRAPLDQRPTMWSTTAATRRAIAPAGSFGGAAGTRLPERVGEALGRTRPRRDRRADGRALATPVGRRLPRRGGIADAPDGLPVRSTALALSSGARRRRRGAA